MGSRGPKPLPANVHLLRGNPSKLRLDELRGEVRPPVAIPPCPKHLLPAAKAEWKRIAKELESLGLISQIDRAALAAYCQAWGRWLQAEEAIRRQADLSDEALAALREEIEKTEGTEARQRLAAQLNIYERGMAGLVQLTPNGMEAMSVNLQIANRAVEQMHKFMAEFGMTPSARSRVTPSDPQMPLPGLESEGGEGSSQGWGSI